IERKLCGIEIGPLHQHHAVALIANNAGRELTTKRSPGRFIALVLGGAERPGLDQRMAYQSPRPDARHELSGKLRGINLGFPFRERAHKSAELLGTRLSVGLRPDTKIVLEKDRVRSLRIVEDDGTGLMVITCRLAALSLALLDEGDNKLLVGVDDDR